LSAAALDSITNSVLDHYIKTKARDQIKENRPLLAAMEAASKTTPGGKGLISLPVRGTYTTGVMGYELDDPVTYDKPYPTRRVGYPWREHHSGIEVTLTELKADGLSVVDSLHSRSTRAHSNRALVVLTGILEEKLIDMMEGYGDGMQQLFWGDGTDPKALAGVRSIVTDNPAIGIVGGIDGAVDTWWQNRASTTAHAAGPGIITSSPTAGGALLQHLQKEYRQLRRYGGKPNLFLAGSDFIDAMEGELRANGNYTLEGFQRKSAVDGGMAELSFKGQPIVYDPYLDNISRAKFGYWLDTARLCPYWMDGEHMKRHSPARPATQYLLYRALTTTGQLTCDSRRCQGVYEIE
jgi:hypothetical protein